MTWRHHAASVGKEENRNEFTIKDGGMLDLQ